MTDTLFTIGYEAATLPDIIARLKAAGVTMLIDVRAVAASRRMGFSKTILANSLRAEGIAYTHLRGLGTPKSGREAARKGRIAEMEAIFSAHMMSPEAEAELARAVVIAKEQPSALLCFEAHASGCHRKIVADMIHKETGMTVTDL